MRKNLLIVFSGPSGVGKGTIINRLLQKENIFLSVSCTTRGPRKGEENGVSYFFLKVPEFEKLIQEDGLLEYSKHFGNYYGTPKKFVEEKLQSGDVILEIEVDGALQVKKKHPEALLIMILPPDENALRERLILRNTESREKIEERIKRMEYEISKKDNYDYVVINDKLDDCVNQIENIIIQERSAKL